MDKSDSLSDSALWHMIDISCTWLFGASGLRYVNLINLAEFISCPCHHCLTSSYKKRGKSNRGGQTTGYCR